MEPATAEQSMPLSDPAPVPALRRARVEFTGTGAEYFGIWIVNLLLTIVTLGIYSAWAKVRKMQYFYRNTRLDGSGFDYHGQPVAILKGRILAVVLAIAYKISMTTFGPYALVAVAALLAVLPWLLTQSYRFRLHNSSYRGIRFRFHGPASGAYLIFAPPMLVLLAPGALALAFGTGDPQHPDRRFLLLFGVMYLALVILWPYLHFSFKRWQHGHAAYGSARTSFLGGAWDFYRPYLLAGLMLVLTAFAAGGFAFFAFKSGAAGPAARVGVPLGLIVFLVLFYGVMLAVAPLVTAWIQNAVWSATRLESIGLSSDLRAGSLVGVTLTNLLMIVFSLGLLIPFAVMRSMKCRIEAIEVLDADALARIGRDADASRVGATGEGAMDVLDLDFGL
jgi:uncharacterized membrane protein YjgN (DUF898 family)